MPIISIDSDKFREGLKKLGVPALIVTAIVAYFISVSPTKYMTYEEYRATIAAYNAKFAEIRADCKNDKRCLEEGKQKKILFTNVSSKQEILKKINTWIEQDEANPNAYKK